MPQKRNLDERDVPLAVGYKPTVKSGAGGTAPVRRIRSGFVHWLLRITIVAGAFLLGVWADRYIFLQMVPPATIPTTRDVTVSAQTTALLSEDIDQTPTATLDPGQPVWIIQWVSQNEDATFTVDGALYAREEDLLLMLGQTLIVRAAEVPVLLTLSGDQLFLSAGGEIEIRDRERRLLAGRLVVQAIAQEQIWQNQLGSQAVITPNGIAGLETDVNNPALFALHCFAGVCTLKGDLAADVVTLAAGQSSAVRGAGRPGEVELANYIRFSPLASSIIPTPTATHTPTSTNTPKPTPTSTRARPVATRTNTPVSPTLQNPSSPPDSTSIPTILTNTPQLPTATPLTSPSVALLSHTLIDTCKWNVQMRLSGFTPNSKVTVSSRYSEIECRSGNHVNASWVQVYHTATDAHGYLTVTYLHQGTGSYNYVFTDERGISAFLSFATKP